MTVRVALVDDHQAFRARLRALLERDSGLEVVAEASSGHELIEIARARTLDVVCMDIRLPGMTGIETTRRLLAIAPDVRVIGLSAYAEPHYVEAMLRAGAVGHFTKGDVGDALLEAIRHATAARPIFGANIVVTPNADRATQPAGAAAPEAVEAPLAPKEAEVLRLIARGLSQAQIERAMSIDSSMVDVYRRALVRKLNLADDRGLDEYARARPLDTDQKLS
jgi:two-component system NarL family response regulator